MYPNNPSMKERTSWLAHASMTWSIIRGREIVLGASLVQVMEINIDADGTFLFVHKDRIRNP